MERDYMINNNKLSDIVETMPDAFAYHKIVKNSAGETKGYVFLKVNNAFEQMTGLKRENIIGKNVVDVIPNIVNSSFDWIKTYSDVASTGKSINFKQYDEHSNKWFDISAFSEESGFFSTVFHEITEEMNEKNSMEQIVEVSECCFKNFGERYVYEKIAEVVKNISGAMAVSFNVYDDDGKNFKTEAISGSQNQIEKIKDILGFNPLDRKWEHDLHREKLIRNSEITQIQKLSDLVGEVIPKKAIILLEQLFSVGKVYLVKITKDELMLGDFTIIMPDGKDIQNMEFIKILNNLTGQYLERKKVQNELLKTTEELEGFFDVNLDLLCIAENNGKFKRINKAWTEVLGYTEDEILNSRYFDFIHPDDLQATMEAESNLANERDVLDFVNRYRAKDGSYKYIEWKSHPIGGLFYAAARDITEKINSQKLLADEHNKMMTIFENMSAVVYVVDINTYEILYLNHQGIADFGNLKGKICSEKLHPEYNQLCNIYPVNELKTQQKISDYKNHREYYNHLSKKWYQCTESIIRWIDGRDVILTVSLDITNRVNLEKERFIEQEKFKTTLLSVGDAIIATDDKGDITVMNSVAENLSGWSQEEAMGKPLDEVFNIIHEFTKKKCDNPAKQVLLTGEIIELANHTALVTKSGKLLPIEDSAAPIKDANGIVMGVVIVFRDYTQKREQLKKVEFLSFNDHLTGLFNRRYMEEILKKLDKEENLPFAITVVDVNGLKLTNDAYGHEMGDRLLITVADILKEVSGENDIVARTGGDEFVILHPKTNQNEAGEFKQKINDLASKSRLESVIVSLAVGYEIKTKPNQDIYETMRQADNKMYKNKLKSGKFMRSQTIEAVLRNINHKYDREQIHTEKVSQYCASIGKYLKFNDKQIEEVKAVGVLHDIGKIVISPEILNKGEKLTPSEIAEIRRHPIIGYNILKGVEEYAALADSVLYHHERWDGNGYPSGIKGEKIPVYSRITSIADAYEAMTSKRPYQSTKTKNEAIDELIKNSGTQFDPEMVKIFVENVL